MRNSLISQLHFQLTWIRSGESTLSLTGDTSEIKEIYTDEGIEVTETNKTTGKVAKDFWERQIEKEGWYKCTSTENMEAFYEGSGERSKIIFFLNSTVNSFTVTFI